MTTYKYLLDNNIDFFTYRGTYYSLISLVHDDDCWLNLPIASLRMADLIECEERQ